jgi:murein DD-endopeptidase MepM/ murein hydrolase activator NlpD
MAGCANTPREERDTYVVRPQDTLYSIAWRYGLDFHDLARWNNIGPDFRIAVGQALTLRAGRAAAAAAGTSRTQSNAHAAVQAPPTVTAHGWGWPTDRVGEPRPVLGGGVLLPGMLGQEIRAASAGRVVYAGSGIRGYGNLIIIKHGENLLSAYAHNRELLVHEGQEVSLGQVIAHMGEGAPQKPVLYFEIRRNGKPIDPLRFLSGTK